MREKHIEQALTRAVKKAGGWAVKLNSTGTAGMPDRLIIIPGGGCAFVETKAPGGRIRPIQQHRHDQLRKLGHRVWVISHTDQIEEALHDMLHPTPIPAARD